MAIGDEKLGTKGEFDLRDDDRPGANAYAGRKGTGFGAMLIIGLVAAAVFVGYITMNRGQVPSPAEPQPTAGSTR